MPTTPTARLCVDCATLSVVKKTAGPRSIRCAAHRIEFRRHTQRASKHRARTGRPYPGKYVPGGLNGEAVRVTRDVIDELRAIRVVFDRTVVNLQYNRPVGISLTDPWFVEYRRVYDSMGRAAQDLEKLIVRLERSMRTVD